MCWPSGVLPGLLTPSPTINDDGCDKGEIDRRALYEHDGTVYLDFFTAVPEPKARTARDRAATLMMAEQKAELERDSKRNGAEGFYLKIVTDSPKTTKQLYARMERCARQQSHYFCLFPPNMRIRAADIASIELGLLARKINSFHHLPIHS